MNRNTVRGVQQGTALTLLLLAVVIAYSLWAKRETPVSRHAASEPVAAPAADEHNEHEYEPTRPSSPVAPLTSISVRSASPKPEAPLDEPKLMQTLRELGDSAPELSLELARTGNARYPNSADAAERGWYVCKSLVNLERFYDAREEARIMVATYPGTPWALDIERHLLVNPLDLPEDRDQ